MKIKELNIPEVILIEPTVFEDERGFFFESFNEASFKKSLNLDIKFIQDNHSKSSKGVLRGLHFQTDPFAQAKLVRVVHGEIFDVAVDLRKNSKNFGKDGEFNMVLIRFLLLTFTLIVSPFLH